MKKRISGMIALGMALTLTFGMTAFAAEPENPSPGKVDVITDQKETADLTAPTEAEKAEVEKKAETISAAVKAEETKSKTSTGTEVEVKIAALPSDTNEQLAVVKSADTAATKIAEKIAAKESKKVTAQVIAGAEISAEIPKGESLTLEITLPNFKVKTGFRYMVLHLDEVNKVWESVPATVSNGKVVATFTSLSPVVVVEVETTAEEKPEPTTPPSSNDNNNNNDSSNSSSNDSQSNPAVSPATGETFPVAGMAALICLAGAAVCAVMFRRNRQDA